MRRTLILTVLAGLLSVFMAFPATAGGLTADKLANAGWHCGNAGPFNWMHCDKAEEGALSITVMVFTTDGDTFLGTESLLHKDVYAGQPCPQDNLDTWIFLEPLNGRPYYACHHFDRAAVS